MVFFRNLWRGFGGSVWRDDVVVAVPMVAFCAVETVRLRVERIGCCAASWHSWTLLLSC